MAQQNARRRGLDRETATELDELTTWRGAKSWDKYGGWKTGPLLLEQALPDSQVPREVVAVDSRTEDCFFQTESTAFARRNNAPE